MTKKSKSFMRKIMRWIIPIISILTAAVIFWREHAVMKAQLDLNKTEVKDNKIEVNDNKTEVYNILQSVTDDYNYRIRRLENQVFLSNSPEKNLEEYKVEAKKKK